jgi:hypothetical protein
MPISNSRIDIADRFWTISAGRIGKLHLKLLSYDRLSGSPEMPVKSHFR